MKSVVFHAHGGIDVLRYEDVVDPVPAEGDVLLKVAAVGLNHADIFARRGMSGVSVPLPMTTGIDIAGEVVATTSAAAGWSPGDRALVYPVLPEGLVGETLPGGMCELFACRASALIRLPPSLPFVTAAALPAAYGTAHRMLTTRGALQAGERVVILAASGGVGVACVQLAKHLGCTVLACAGSAAKAARLAALGADHVVDTSAQDVVDVSSEVFGRPRLFDKATGEVALFVDDPAVLPGADVVVNFTGGDTWTPALRCLRFQGRMLTCGATAGHEAIADVRYVFSRELSIVGSTGWTPLDQEAVVELAATGAIEPVVDRVLPLADYAEAFRLLEDRRVVGKVVLTP